MNRIRAFYHHLKIQQKIALGGIVLSVFTCCIISLFYWRISYSAALRQWDDTNAENLTLLEDGLNSINRRIVNRLSHLSKSITVQHQLKAQTASAENYWDPESLLRDMQAIDEI